MIHFVFFGVVFYYSGAITKHFAVAKKLMANFILESFFSPLQVKKYINEKARDYLTPENIGMYCPFNVALHSK